MPSGQALFRQGARLAPLLEVRGQLVVPPEDARELLVPGKRTQVREMAGVGAFRQRRVAARLPRQLVKPRQQPPGRRRFLVRPAIDARGLKELPQLQALPGVDGGALHPEVGVRDLGLVELGRAQRHAVHDGAQAPGAEQADEGRVDGVPRPAVR